ncbi:alpha/beta-Hydrolases superfamily protein [Rhynchospora pubera]|uniref:Alpha/beta-Hydrolases superfamily protein n=1 Tax=Rhynchospora pubera TaxID=906938 RepID=A0AAV8GM34_9POAL|nr:alpha/beta-Hydrolases superfamily protein [Rhynchospora pubera]KAJ4806069.1 alpha/beta-Hydrolases superfamily protein [Rhynchospora pubera]
MASFSGLLQRPLSTVAVVTAAAVWTDIPDLASNRRQPDLGSKLDAPPLTGLTFLTPGAKLCSNGSCHVENLKLSRTFCAPVASIPVMQTVYQYARIAELKEPEKPIPSISSASSDVMYKWHLPDPRAYQVSGDNCSSIKSKAVVVLLGWLGSKQRHLKKYAEWYTSKGYHVITFTFPMSDVVSYRVGGKAERDLELLASHLANWVEEEGGSLVFHTFSNTGWLAYGGILEKLRKKDPSSIDKIKGCIVDSAPVDAPDPQVWASGFSAAFLKKNSVASRGSLPVPKEKRTDVLVVSESGSGLDLKPAFHEAALLGVLEKFFDVILNIPSINRRLSDILDVLSSNQPKCPQLYIYSSADRVIPAKSVESFIEKQRKAGHSVRSCDFVSSPHVDHYRNHPALYTTQLTQFLEDCLLRDCH